MFSHIILCFLICSASSWVAPSDGVEGEVRGGGEGGGGGGGGNVSIDSTASQTTPVTTEQGGGGGGNVSIDSTASQTTPVTTEQGGGGGGEGGGGEGDKKKEEEEEEEEEVDFMEYYATVEDESKDFCHHNYNNFNT